MSRDCVFNKPSWVSTSPVPAAMPHNSQSGGQGQGVEGSGPGARPKRTRRALKEAAPTSAAGPASGAQLRSRRTRPRGPPKAAAAVVNESPGRASKAAMGDAGQDGRARGRAATRESGARVPGRRNTRADSHPDRESGGNRRSRKRKQDAEEPLQVRQRDLDCVRSRGHVLRSVCRGTSWDSRITAVVGALAAPHGSVSLQVMDPFLLLPA